MTDATAEPEHSTMVYEYGLVGDPETNLDLVEDQMRKAHRYRNLLVEIERERRAAVLAALASHPSTGPLEDEAAALTERIEDAERALKSANRALRKRSPSPDVRAEHRELAAKLKDVRARIKVARTTAKGDPAVQAEIAAANERARERLKAGRAASGVYWGTYLLQEADADRARQEASPPKFRAWRGEGRVQVQIQNGMSVAELFGGSHSQLHIVRPDKRAWDSATPRGERRRAQRTTVHMRVQSERAKPVWASWRMIMHRPLPEGSRIKAAVISRRRRNCLMWRWSLQLTVAVPLAMKPAPSSGIVALNLGYSPRPGGGIRSGYLVADDGYEREIVVAPDIIEGLARAARIQGYRDKNVDTLRAALTCWLRMMAEDCTSLCATQDPEMDVNTSPRTRDLGPNDIILSGSVAGSVCLSASGESSTICVKCGGAGWLWGNELDIQSRPYQETGQDDTRYFCDRCTHRKSPAKQGHVVEFRGYWLMQMVAGLELWRSPARFRRLALFWASHRFHGDELVFAVLDAWRVREEHLECYQSGLRGTVLRRRRERYRVLAAELARRYKTIVIDDTNIASMIRGHDPTQINRSTAAGSELRATMINAFGKARASKRNPKDMTRTCHACGTVGDRGEQLVITCDACGATWDRDFNFCLNLLRQEEIAQNAPAGETTAPRAPARSARLRAAKAKQRQPGRAAG